MVAGQGPGRQSIAICGQSHNPMDVHLQVKRGEQLAQLCIRNKIDEHGRVRESRVDKQFSSGVHLNVPTDLVIIAAYGGVYATRGT